MKLLFDTPQPRISRDRIGIATSMPELAGDPQTQIGTWVCPVVDCLSLIPAQAEADYLKSNAGRFAKLGLADFGSPSGWTDADVTGGGYLKLLQNPSGGILSTSVSWAANTGFAVHFHNYTATANDERVIVDGGWAVTYSSIDGTGFEISTAGRVVIHRNGTQIGEGKVQLIPKALNTILFIPCRGRELVVIGKEGSGFRVIMPDIAEDATSPVITPATKFHLKGYGTASILATPIRYPSSGTALSAPISLGEAPDGDDEREVYDQAPWIGGTTEARIHGSSPYRGSASAFASVVKLDGSGYTPDGTNRDVRLQTTLTGDGYGSPFLWGVHAGWRGTTENTPDVSSDVTAFLMPFSITVPDGGPATVGITLKSARTKDDGTTELLSSVVDRPATTVNRPFQLFLTEDGPPIVDGVTGPPNRQDATEDEAERLEIEGLDLEAELKSYTLAEPMVFDGYKVCRATEPSAARLILRRVYPLGRISLEDADATYPDIPPEDTSQLNAGADASESGDDALETIVKDGLGLWLRGWRPTATLPMYEIVSPDTILAKTPFCTLYATVADALAGGWENGRLGVWRDLREHRSPAEANVVNVVGRDPRTNRPVRTIKRDDAARNPTTMPEDRPDNWVGSLRRYGLASRQLLGQTETDRAAGLLYERVTPVRRVVEFGCDLPFDADGVPLWRGDRIELDGVGTFVVSSLRIDVPTAESGEDGIRIFRAQVVATDLPSGTGLVTGEEIATASWGDPRRGGIVRRRSSGLTAVVADGTTVL